MSINEQGHFSMFVLCFFLYLSFLSVFVAACLFETWILYVVGNNLEFFIPLSLPVLVRVIRELGASVEEMPL